MPQCLKAPVRITGDRQVGSDLCLDRDIKME